MSKDQNEKSARERRDFLKLATLGTVLGGAAMTTGGAVNAAAPAENRGSGYRETDHVKTYYKLARF